MPNDASFFLSDTGHETGHIHQGHQGDAERVAEADEARGFVRGVHVDGAREPVGLIGHEAHRAPIQATEAGDHVAREARLHLEEVAVIRQLLDDVHHVVGLPRFLRNDLFELRYEPVGIVG